MLLAIHSKFIIYSSCLQRKRRTKNSLRLLVSTQICIIQLLAKETFAKVAARSRNKLSFVRFSFFPWILRCSQLHVFFSHRPCKLSNNGIIINRRLRRGSFLSVINLYYDNLQNVIHRCASKVPSICRKKKENLKKNL